MMPDSVDHHARRQRVVGTGDPLGKLCPSLLAFGVGRKPEIAIEDIRSGRRYFFARLLGAAARKDKRCFGPDQSSNKARPWPLARQGINQLLILLED